MIGVFKISDGTLYIVSDTDIETVEMKESPSDYATVTDFEFDPTHSYTYVDGEVVDNGVYTPSEEELAHYAETDRITNLEQLREERTKRLEATDWWELPSQLPMSEERSAYRQALRDITNTYTSLEDVVWPEKPE
jgi:hypothetical protein